MTLELKMLALSIVLGLVQIVLASHAASLQRGYVWTASSRDEAVPALTGVAGRLAAGAAKFRRDVSSVRCRRPDSARCGHARLDDRVGCSALFLGSRRLSRLVRSRGFSAALPCMERGGARNRLDPSVAGRLGRTPNCVSSLGELRLYSFFIGKQLLHAWAGLHPFEVSHTVRKSDKSRSNCRARRECPEEVRIGGRKMVEEILATREQIVGDLE